MGQFEIIQEANQRPKPGLAKALRKSPTSGEAAMWEMVRAKRLDGYKFRRQHVMGNYIVDFVCLGRSLVVELDGRFHDPVYDAARDAWLTSQGYRVLRFSNTALFEDRFTVMETISAALRGTARTSTLEDCDHSLD